MEIKNKIFNWIDAILKNPLPDGIVAFNFNLYEGVDSFHIQLIGASQYSKDDEDWATNELYTTGENIFVIPRNICGQEWQKGLSFLKNIIEEYLNKGNYKGILKRTNAVGIGFVDGDIEILYEKK